MGLIERLFGPPSTEKFAQAVIAAMQRNGEKRPILFDTTTFSLSIGEEGQEFLNLGNFYSVFCEAPRSERAALVEHTATVRANTPDTIPDTFDAARALLMPAVRSMAYYEFSNLRLELQGFKVRIDPGRQLSGHIGVGLVLDYPQSTRGIGVEHLEEWGVSFDEAFETAEANLRARSDRSGLQKVVDGVWVSTWEDAYDSSRLLLPDLLHSIPVRGEPVVMIPARDLLLMTGADDEAGLAAIAAIAKDASGRPQPISARPMIFRGAWEEFEFAAGHPLGSVFKRLILEQAVADYDEQTELLKAVHSKREDDTFAARFMATEHRDSGVLSSFCTWSDAGVQLLPRSERIAFSRTAGKPESLGFVRWETVERIVGDLMERTENYPPRFRVKGLPDDERLRRILVEAE